MKSTKNGFTLLELIVVAGIFSAITFVIAQVFFTTIRSNKKTETYRDIKQNGDQALDTMVRLLQNAIVVSASSCPDRSEAPAVLDSLTLTHADGTSTTLSCDAMDGYARIASSSAGKRIYLTNENVSLYDAVASARDCTNHALAFFCTSDGDTPSVIRISYTLVQKQESASSYEQAQASFETTVALRNK